MVRGEDRLTGTRITCESVVYQLHTFISSFVASQFDGDTVAFGGAYFVLQAIGGCGDRSRWRSSQ